MAPRATCAEVDRPNQVWAMDITYIPMARGFVYLAAVVDWFSRRVLSHRVSITMEADFCVEALKESLAKHDAPGIFNTDQRRDGRVVTRRRQRPSQPVAPALRATVTLISQAIIGSPPARSAAESDRSGDRKSRHSTPSASTTICLEADRLNRSTRQIVKTP